ncbi:hypothetical protein PTKIN_Ptkin04bG0072100 [Pterospermum kingtungense]
MELVVSTWNGMADEDPVIPTVDLSPFFREDDDDGKRKAMEVISKACSEYGFFQIANHGVRIDLLQRALQLSKIFFDYPAQEKLKSSPASIRIASVAPLPVGYNTQRQHCPDKNEYLLMFPPGSTFNVFPHNPHDLRKVLEDVFSNLTKTCMLVEGIMNQCLGFPTNFLEEFNHDRSWDFMVALRYFPANETDNNGLTEHEDANFITFVFQDEAGGLEVRKDGKWIPVIPSKDTIVVNLGDIIQSQFTQDIGEPSKYRGFMYKEYLQLRMKNKTHPPSRPEDEIRITHYKITT